MATSLHRKDGDGVRDSIVVPSLEAGSMRTCQTGDLARGDPAGNLGRRPWSLGRAPRQPLTDHALAGRGPRGRAPRSPRSISHPLRRRLGRLARGPCWRARRPRARRAGTPAPAPRRRPRRRASRPSWRARAAGRASRGGSSEVPALESLAARATAHAVVGFFVASVARRRNIDRSAAFRDAPTPARIQAEAAAPSPSRSARSTRAAQ